LTRAESGCPHRGQSDILAGISCQQLLQCACFMPVKSTFVPSWCCQRRDISVQNGTSQDNWVGPDVTTASAGSPKCQPMKKGPARRSTQGREAPEPPCLEMAARQDAFTIFRYLEKACSPNRTKGNRPGSTRCGRITAGRVRADLEESLSYSLCVPRYAA